MSAGWKDEKGRKGNSMIKKQNKKQKDHRKRKGKKKKRKKIYRNMKVKEK